MKPIKQTVYLPVIEIEENRTNIPSSIQKEEWGVHRTHCCKKHGCKYGDKDCPVALGHIKQDYECEDGYYDDSCFKSDVNLVKQEGYFFSSEQLNKYTTNVIKQALENAAENAEVKVTENALIEDDSCYTTYDDGVISVTSDKKSITNTFEETYNKLKV